MPDNLAACLLKDFGKGLYFARKVGKMKYFFRMFSIVAVFCLFLSGCSNPTSGGLQYYDMYGYIISLTDYTNTVQPKAASYGSNVTKAQINEFEQWLIVNVSFTLDPPARNLTRSEIADVFLANTSISQSNLDELFEETDTIGKTVVFGMMPRSQVEVIFIERL
jgi:hypothetical protein